MTEPGDDELPRETIRAIAHAFGFLENYGHWATQEHLDRIDGGVNTCEQYAQVLQALDTVPEVRRLRRAVTHHVEDLRRWHSALRAVNDSAEEVSRLTREAREALDWHPYSDEDSGGT